MERNERIIILRLLRGLTQDQLAARSGLPRGSISIWEKGTNAPSHQAAPILADALGVPVGYLMYGSPPLESAVWQPLVPAARHKHVFERELSKKFSMLCTENNITRCIEYNGVDGTIYFMGGAKKSLSFMLLIKKELQEIFFDAIDLKEHINIKNEIVPRVNIGFLDEMDVDHLNYFFGITKETGVAINQQIITREFLRATRLPNKPCEKYDNRYAHNAFLHFLLVQSEFEMPEMWNSEIINPRALTLNENLGIIFDRVAEEAKNKMLIWDGRPNDHLMEMLRRHLKSQGLKGKQPNAKD
jgi:transcriptional regulator with XRE-family HTH domain